MNISFNFDLMPQKELRCVLLASGMMTEVLSVHAVFLDGQTKKTRCTFFFDKLALSDDLSEFYLNMRLNNVYLIDFENSNKKFRLNKCTVYSTCMECTFNTCHWNHDMFKCDYLPTNKSATMSCPYVTKPLVQLPIVVSYSQDDSLDSYQFQLNNFYLNSSLKLYCVFNDTVYTEVKIINSEVGRILLKYFCFNFNFIFSMIKRAQYMFSNATIRQSRTHSCPTAQLNSFYSFGFLFPWTRIKPGFIGSTCNRRTRTKP
jgi:hypothetical protein